MKWETLVGGRKKTLLFRTCPYRGEGSSKSPLTLKDVEEAHRLFRMSNCQNVMIISKDD